MEFYVIKRSGNKEIVSFDKISERIKNLSYDLNNVNITKITQMVISRLTNEIKTSQLDELAGDLCNDLVFEHPEYSVLASRILISNLQKETSDVFSEVVRQCYFNFNTTTGKLHSLVNEEYYNFVMENKDVLNSMIDYKRDFLYDVFGFKTLKNKYLLYNSEKILERPQHMHMRIAITVNFLTKDLNEIANTYNLLSNHYYTHASPTIFNSGTKNKQLSSCFLMPVNDDSLNGIFKTISDFANISKYSGGVGISCSNIRCRNSPIDGTNGISNGIVPMIRVFNNTSLYIDQGGGKRKGSLALYLEPWHGDIFEFLELKKNTGANEERARDCFYGLWVPDLFMKRVKENGKWTLFCPNTIKEYGKQLYDIYGEEFEEYYIKYEKLGIGIKQIDAMDLWKKIIISQIETGMPYMCYKDSVNKKSNQINVGVIRSSNLCTEIMEYSSPDQTAVCNLASINLSSIVKDNEVDYKLLHSITKIVTKNLNSVIDINFYPVKESEKSNNENRPIGIGVQGLANLFIKLKLPFTSEKAREINKLIFETIYHASLEMSCEIAERDGKYKNYTGSPIDNGLLQYDLWNVTPSNLWNWDELKLKISTYGVRNSLLVALMPTATTSQMLGNYECIEPITSNIYVRRTSSGDFVNYNKYLAYDLIELGLWNKNIINKIISNKGSIKHIEEIPLHIKEIYKTVWEIKQKDLIDMAVDRAPFVCQSQSLNIHMLSPNDSKISSMHFYSWEKGLKTGLYYLRTKPQSDSTIIDHCENCSA